MLKELHNAIARDNQQAVRELTANIEANGGLSKYQEASMLGQSADRGGDSSKVLVGWLAEGGLSTMSAKTKGGPLKMLEVGALNVDNACARSGLFEMERIDLHSQHPLIKKEDYMQRLIPAPGKSETEGFDVVSLSLVVNFAPDAIQRGEMLKRAGKFLRHRSDISGSFFPGLFLVLPAACVMNSRYLDEERLEAIMTSLGYSLARRKLSAKLVYYLWRSEETNTTSPEVFKKEEIRSGASRNNFAIMLR